MVSNFQGNQISSAIFISRKPGGIFADENVFPRKSGNIFAGANIFAGKVDSIFAMVYISAGFQNAKIAVSNTCF